MIVDKNRQIHFINNSLSKFLNEELANNWSGKRPVDMVNCVNAKRTERGCGFSDYCKFCNILNSILESIDTNKVVSNDVIIVSNDDYIESSLYFKLSISPICSIKETYYILTLKDNRDKIRRKQLKKTFFHNVINTVEGLSNLISLLRADVPLTLISEIEFIQETFEDLVEEIQFHREILNAINREFHCKISSIDSEKLLKAVIKPYIKNDNYKEKQIVLSDQRDRVAFKSDYIILKKTLSNIVKNALEATERGNAVTLNCILKDDKLIFTVHNKEVIPDYIKAHIFKRSFSTKGSGRGWGTYSIKLFINEYLNGKVSFSSEIHSGTTFKIPIPIDYYTSI